MWQKGQQKSLDGTHQIEVPLWPRGEEDKGAPSPQWPKQYPQEMGAQLKYVHCY